MPPKASGTAQAGRRVVTRDWNLVWASKNLADLSAIPIHSYGFCGCSLCGTRTAVKGSTFIAHMRELHASRTPAYKRARTISQTPGPSVPAVARMIPNPPPILPVTLEVSENDNDYADIDSDPMTFNLPADLLPLESLPLPDRQIFDRPASPAADNNDEADLPDETIRQALEAMFEQHATDESDLVEIRPLTPEPVAEYLSALPPGDFDGAATSTNDMLEEFTVDIPLSMREPTYSGARPNPHIAFSTEEATVPVLQRALPLLAHAMSGLYGVARRPINLVLQVSSIVVRNAENRLYQRFRRWYAAHHPDAPPARLEQLDNDLNPAFDSPAAPNTLETALRRIGVNDSLLVHPVCPNRDCFNVFYHITNREDFAQLPKTCPTCSTELYREGKSIARHFARRTLKDELEIVLTVRGVEEALDRRDERKRIRDEEDAKLPASIGTVYRQQDDGSAWARTDEGNLASQLRDALEVTVNLSIDWAQQSSRRTAATDSIGPIILQLADLPAQLRSSFACAMVVGITPGPKSPKPANLYKFMLPIAMELRDSEVNGLWLQTPKHPQGRLVRVRLGLTVCDRPAAVELTGGPFYMAHATPCLRCLIHTSQILDLTTWEYPLRNSDAHSRAIFRQIKDLPGFLKRHADDHRIEQQRLVSAGEISKPEPYTKRHLEAAIAMNNAVAGNPTALAAIPGYDKFGMSVFDPMHALLEGMIKTYFHKVLVAGKHSSAGDPQLAGEDVMGEGSTAGEVLRDELVADTDGESVVETEWGSDGEAAQAQTIAERVIVGYEKGDVVVPTQAEIATLRKGVKRMGKQGKGKAKASKPRRKRLGDAGVARLQELLSEVISPTSVARLHPEFGSPSAGTPTASHWKAFASVHGPLTIPLLFHERGRMDTETLRGNAHLTASELEAMMLLFEVVSLAVRTTISEALLARLESLLMSFLGLAFSLHPTLHHSTNFHVVLHIPNDIRRFGPAPGWWTFPTERVQYVIKNTNLSGANKFQASVLGLRAIVKGKQMISARMNALDVPANATQEDRDLVDELADTFAAFHQEDAANTLEQIALRFLEIDRLSLSSNNDLSSARTLVHPRGISQERTLDDTTLALLQECLRKFGQDTRSVLDVDGGDESLPYLPSRATFWQGVVFGGNRRLDSAEWGKPLRMDVNPAGVRDLVRSRNALIESVREELILDASDRRGVSGVLCAVFEHRASGAGGERMPARLFGIVRKLKKYDGPDVFGYRKHPSLGVWLWEYDSLERPTILWLNPTTLASLRPLAAAALPQSPKDKDGGMTWATIPIPYH